MENKVFYFNNDTKTLSIGSSKHYHQLFEIYYMKKGSCSYFIDKRVFNVSTGDLVLIPEGVIHKTNYNAKPHARLLINCSSHYIPSAVQGYISKLVYLYRNDKATPKIEEIFEKIEEEWTSPDEFTDDAILYLVHSLFFTIARNHNKFANKPSGNALIEKCVREIQENFMHRISLSDTAKRYSVSPEHLSRTFKKQTGFGFNEFVTLVRLQKAEEMLKNENGKSISEIAFACGFNDSNYFSDKFKKAYGTVPSKLREKSVK